MGLLADYRMNLNVSGLAINGKDPIRSGEKIIEYCKDAGYVHFNNNEFSGDGLTYLLFNVILELDSKEENLGWDSFGKTMEYFENQKINGCSGEKFICFINTWTEKSGYDVKTLIFSYGENDKKIIEDQYSIGKFEYGVNNETNKTITINGYSRNWDEINGKFNLNISSTIDGYTVTSIGSWEFANNTELNSVSLPSTVTKLESVAFYNCSNLEKVEIQKDSNLSIIEDWVFCRSALSEIFIPKTVSQIGNYVLLWGNKTLTINGYMDSFIEEYAKNNNIKFNCLDKVEYKVNYYLQDINSDNYTLDKSISNTIKEGTNITPEVFTYEGFISPKQQIITVTQDNKIINYYYQRNKYFVQYNGNGATSGKMSNSLFYYDESRTLAENEFKQEYEIEFDHNYEGRNNIKKNISSRFIGWTIEDGEEILQDQKLVKNLTKKNNDVIVLNAKWEDKVVVGDNSTYKLDNDLKVISNVSLETNSAEFYKNVKINANSYELININNNIIEGDTYIGTGNKINMQTEIENDCYEISVKGDISGDGVMDVIDLAKLKKALLGILNTESKSLEGSYKISADINDDGQIDIVDLARMKKLLIQ